MHGNRDHNPHGPSMMAELLGQIPSNDADFFTIRALDMKGRKVEIASPPMQSPIHCFFFLAEGEAMVSIGKDMYFFQPGECCVIPAGQVFSIRYFDDCTGYMGGFNSDFMCSSGHSPHNAFASLRRWGYHKVSFSEQVAANVEGLLDRIYAENISTRNTKIIKAYLVALFTEIEEATENGTHTGDNAVCNSFLELVFDNIGRNWQLADYASETNVSEEHLRKVVKRCTGKSPLEWINEARIIEAKSLLFNTLLSVNEVSQRVGIEDPAYFSRLFKKNTGITPVQYREERKKSYTITD